MRSLPQRPASVKAGLLDCATPSLRPWIAAQLDAAARAAGPTTPAEALAALVDRAFVLADLAAARRDRAAEGAWDHLARLVRGRRPEALAYVAHTPGAPGA